jgi:hypothetical protein
MLDSLRNMVPMESLPQDEFVWALPFATGECSNATGQDTKALEMDSRELN